MAQFRKILELFRKSLVNRGTLLLFGKILPPLPLVVGVGLCKVVKNLDVFYRVEKLKTGKLSK